jgi:putative toxin-antitoxin system antitoxin component (TIGR02293 family)
MANPSLVSEELRRTLSFLGGVGGAVADAAMARTRGAAGDLPPRRARKGFFVFSPEDPRTPLLYASAVGLLADRLDIEEKQLLDVSSIPKRTFHRRQQKAETLSATETDRVLRIARIASLATQVFGSDEKARRWLSKDNRMLGAMPLQMLATDAGAHEVEAELNRIEFGDFA